MAYDEVIRNPNGGGVIFCRMGGKRPAKCSFCFAMSTKLCDYPVSPGKTCDKPMCKTHSVSGSELWVCTKCGAPHVVPPRLCTPSRYCGVNGCQGQDVVKSPDKDYCRDHAHKKSNGPSPAILSLKAGSGTQAGTQPVVSGINRLPLRGLSIRQPWAWLITHSPEGKQKNYENRTWKAAYRGPVLIHASLQPVLNWREVVDTVFKKMGVQVDINCTCGAIVGISTIVDCVDASRYDLNDEANFWLQGPWAFKLENSRPFTKSIPYRGGLGFLTIPRDPVIIEQIKEHKEYHGII